MSPPAYCEQINEPGSVRHVLDRSLHTAMSERTVTAVITPADVQDTDAVPEQPKATRTVHSGLGFWPGRRIPAEQDPQAATGLLNAGDRVAMVVGAGVMNATDEVIATADVLGAGIAKALLGKAAVPDDVPFCTGVDRAAGHQAELGHDAGRRHPAERARFVAVAGDYSLCDNDKASIAYSTKVITGILHAAGAQDVLTIHRYAHLIGGARMGTSPDNSVVDSSQRAWAVPNLFLADGSVCPTPASANPALTIMALSSRLAERIRTGAAPDDDPAARGSRAGARQQAG